jgi:hypothetical protein
MERRVKIYIAFWPSSVNIGKEKIVEKIVRVSKIEKIYMNIRLLFQAMNTLEV